MTSDLAKLRDRAINDIEGTLVLMNTETKTVITTAETTHELAMETKSLEYNEENSVLFAPWHADECTDIKMQYEQSRTNV